MTRAYVRVLLGIVLLASGLVPSPSPLLAQAQAPEPLPRFEVASVKPSTGPTGERGQPGGSYIATRTVKFFIADAFFFGTPLQMSRVIGGPEWIESALYEINAQASTPWQRSPDGPPRELFMMIRSLLEERFKLKTHMETRELPVYELVLARADRSLGPQLRESTASCDALIAALQAGGAAAGTAAQRAAAVWGDARSCASPCGRPSNGAVREHADARHGRRQWARGERRCTDRDRQDRVERTVRVYAGVDTRTDT